MQAQTIALLILTFGIAVVLTVVIKKVATYFKIVDLPNKPRKIHSHSTPLLGGVAVILSFILGMIFLWPQLQSGQFLTKHLLGVIIGSIFILIGGILDDRFDLAPRWQIIFPMLATISIITAGIGISYITNPFGDLFYLDSIKFTVFTIKGIPYALTLLADLFTLLWLTGMMYTTKFLDGLDGLVSGVTVIGSVIIFILSLSQEVLQADTALLAALVAVVFLGFLFFNWHPAKIFLGESGSLFAGFILGVLAIISGGKIATALLILGVPIFDVLWVIFRRFFLEKKSPFLADRQHLHLRLLDIGLSHRQVVLILYTLTTIFGVSALFLQSKQKAYVLLLLLTIMIILGFILVHLHKKKAKRNNL